jgi:hypothetical protein
MARQSSAAKMSSDGSPTALRGDAKDDADPPWFAAPVDAQDDEDSVTDAGT